MLSLRIWAAVSVKESDRMSLTETIIFSSCLLREKDSSPSTIRAMRLLSLITRSANSMKMIPVFSTMPNNARIPNCGMNPNGFDGHGNYNLRLSEQLVFPELNPDKFTRPQGMNITLVTSTDSDDEARELLRNFGMPLKSDDASATN